MMPSRRPWKASECQNCSASVTRALYQNYYGDGAVETKRGISALDAMAHMKAVAASASFDRVVDVGAGEGSLLQILDDSGFARELYALEISPTAAQAIAARKLKSLVEIKPFNGYHIPYPDGFFDLAILCHVLEHVEHERILLRELRRIARHIIVEVPIEHGVRVGRKIAGGARFGHINFYLPETAVNLLQNQRSAGCALADLLLITGLRAVLRGSGPGSGDGCAEAHGAQSIAAPSAVDVHLPVCGVLRARRAGGRAPHRGGDCLRTSVAVVSGPRTRRPPTARAAGAPPPRSRPRSLVRAPQTARTAAATAG